MPRMKRWITVLALGAFGALFAAPALAQQSRVSVEGRMGAGLPAGELEDIGAESGLSVGADVMYSFSPAVTGYAGLSHDRFGCDEGNGNACDDRLISSGFQTGLKFLLSSSSTGLPWIRAGLIGQDLDTGQTESDLSLGVEAGAGIDINVGPNFLIVPAIQARGYSADMGPGDVDVRYLVFSIGGHVHF